MKAISSSAALKPQSNYKFNSGTELNESFDVDYYETYFRNYDAQIGRFTGIDAMSEKTMSFTTYQFGGNNPIFFNDSSGLFLEPPEITKDWTYGYHDPFGGMMEFTTYMSSGGGSSNAPYYDSEWGYLDGPNPDGSAIAKSKFGGYYTSDGSFVAFDGQQALDVGTAYNNLHNSWSNTFAGSAYAAQIIYNALENKSLGNDASLGGSGPWVGIGKFDDDSGPGKGLWQSVKKYAANVGTAAKMTLGWVFGVGADSRTFIDDRVAKALRNSPGVNTLRESYYSNGTVFYHYNFGLSGLWHAGLDPIEQYVGSYDVTVAPIAGSNLLQFTITNLTSLRSADYHITPSSWNISSGYPLGNFWQTYIFTEPIRK